MFNPNKEKSILPKLLGTVCSTCIKHISGLMYSEDDDATVITEYAKKFTQICGNGSCTESLKELGILKEFKVSWVEYCHHYYSGYVDAIDEDHARELYSNGLLDSSSEEDDVSVEDSNIIEVEQVS